MAYLIIAIIVLLALAPLWHMMPSKGQRRVASLREAAALSGLFVEFRDLPLPPKMLERLSAADRQVLYYGVRLRPSRGEPRPQISWTRSRDNDWQSSPRGKSLPESLASLPTTVLGFSVSESSCGLFWREEGDAEDVHLFAATLIKWSEQIG